MKTEIHLIEKVRSAPVIGDFIRFCQGISNDRVNVYAAQAAFFIIVSAVPFLMLLASLMTYVLPMGDSEWIMEISEALPSALAGYVKRIARELYTQSSVPLISVTACSVLWAASKSVYALMQGLGVIYHAKETRNAILVRIWAIIHTILLLGLLIAMIMLLLFGNRLHDLIHARTSFGLAGMIIYFRFTWCLMLMIIVFLAMYRILPNHKTTNLAELPGAIFSTIGCFGFSWLYALYIDHYAEYSVTYGSLTAVVLLMIWLYICMKIILIGGEINHWIAQGRNSP